jgi:hypothetical protein
VCCGSITSCFLFLNNIVLYEDSTYAIYPFSHTCTFQFSYQCMYKILCMHVFLFFFILFLWLEWWAFYISPALYLCYNLLVSLTTDISNHLIEMISLYWSGSSWWFHFYFPNKLCDVIDLMSSHVLRYLLWRNVHLNSFLSFTLDYFRPFNWWTPFYNLCRIL